MRFLGILQKLRIDYFSKTLLDGFYMITASVMKGLSYQMIFFLNQCSKNHKMSIGQAQFFVLQKYFVSKFVSFNFYLKYSWYRNLFQLVQQDYFLIFKQKCLFSLLRMFYYVSKTYWNCLFPPMTFFQIQSKFSDFWSRFFI